MGLFDLFTHEGRLKRHALRVANRDAQPEDREASWRWLADDASPRAVYALLTRFDLSLSQQLKDQAEKDEVFKLLVGLGTKVEEPLRQWLPRAKNFALGLRLMAATQGPPAALTAAKALLAAEAQASAFHPEKKKALLIWLSDKTDDAIADLVRPLLTDFDEDVRYAAVDLLSKQPDDAIHEALFDALVRRDEDSQRVRHRIAEAFADRGWALGGREPGPRLPRGFEVKDDHIVRQGAV